MATFADATNKEQRSYKNIPYTWYTKPGGYAWRITIGNEWSSGCLIRGCHEYTF